MAGAAQVFDMFMALADKARKNCGGAKVVEAAGNAPAATGDWRAAIEEWVAALLAAREAAVEAMEVEALAQRHQGPQDVYNSEADTSMTDQFAPNAAPLDTAVGGLQNHDPATCGWIVNSSNDTEAIPDSITAASLAAAGLQGNEQTVLMKVPNLVNDVGEQNLQGPLAAAKAESRQPLLLAEMEQLNLAAAPAAAVSRA